MDPPTMTAWDTLDGVQIGAEIGDQYRPTLLHRRAERSENAVATTRAASDTHSAAVQDETQAEVAALVRRDHGIELVLDLDGIGLVRQFE